MVVMTESDSTVKVGWLTEPKFSENTEFVWSQLGWPGPPAKPAPVMVTGVPPAEVRLIDGVTAIRNEPSKT